MKIKYIFLPIITLLFLFSTPINAQTWLWGQQGSTSLKADVFAGNVATNKSGNVYQTGGFETSVTFGSTTLMSLAQSDAYLVKYDQNGNVLWARQSIGDSNSYTNGFSVTTDDSDNSYITGEATGTITFGLDTLNSSDGIFLVKYDPNGNVMWAKQADTTIIANGTEGWAVTTDKLEHEYVTGDGAFLLEYDRSGNIINYVPETSIYYATGYSIATDISGNIYLAGQFVDTLKFGTCQLYSAYENLFIVKFDNNGNALWAQQSNTNNNFNTYHDVSVTADNSGAVYLTASFEDSIKLGSYTFASTDSTFSFFLVKYNPGGTIAWGKESIPINRNTSCSSTSICSDDSNRIYISGGEWNFTSKNSSFVFANYTVNITDTSANDYPSFLLKLDSSGNIICGSTLFAGGNGPTNGLTSDSTGKFVYMGGGFDESFAIGNDNLIDNIGGYDTYVGRWQSCGDCDLALTITPQSPPVCSGQSVTLTASGAINYSWSPPTGLNITTGNTVIANPIITTTYTVTSGTGSCLATDTDVVTVIPSPNKPTFIQRNDTLISSSEHDNQWYCNDSLLLYDTSQYLIISILGNYYVEVNNEVNGCTTSSDTVNVTSLTGINQLTVERGQLTVYPNPTSDQLTVTSNQLPMNEIDVINELGQVLLKIPTTGPKGVIDLSKFSGGVYFISVVTNSGRTVVPVMKE